MAIDYATLKTLDAAGHPDTGAFSAVAATAATEWNTKNRENTSLDINLVLKFLLLDNTYKTDDGTDTQDRAIWQRMKEVVALADTPTAAVANPWGSSSLGNITEIQQIKTHQLLSLFTLSAQGNLSVNLSDSNFKVYLAGAQAAGCMSTTQETNLLGLNKISYANEVADQINYFGDLTESHILTARSS